MTSHSKPGRERGAKTNIPGRKPHQVAAFEGGWAVFDAEGKRCSGRVQERSYALSVMRDMNETPLDLRGKTIRACMCCRASFKSEGPHNRLCDPCRRRPDADETPNSIVRGGRRG